MRADASANSTGEGTIEQRLHGRIQILVIEAPKRLNALSLAMRLALRDRLREAHENSKVRSIVLTGAGATFSAGGDVRQMAERPTPTVARQRLDVLHDVVRQIVAGPKPVVAAIEGIAYGAGLSLAAACDHVVVAEGSRFSAAFGRLGLVADCGLFWTLPQRVGLGATRDLLMTGRPFNATEALQMGLADALVPVGMALERALEKANEYEAIAPLAITATKSALARHPASLEDALQIEADLQAALRASEDHRNACDAFLHKQSPIFFGR